MPSNPRGDATSNAERGADGVNPAHERFGEMLATMVPHNRALGIRFVATQGGTATLGLPYDEKLIGNPLTRVLHGGAITALMDATCGIAVFLKLREAIPIATLDLRIDYIRPATPGLEVLARGDCFKVTKNIAFVRCEAFHPEFESDLVAVATGTFILTPPSASGKKSGAP